MGTKTLDTVERTFQKTNNILGEIEARLVWDGRRQQSYQLLRAVLHTLRDRLTVDEAASFSAQLTLFLKGVFYDGWKPSRAPIKMNKEEFINAVDDRITFDHNESVEQLIKDVVNVLRNYINPHEFEKVQSWLPEDMRDLVE